MEPDSNRIDLTHADGLARSRSNDLLGGEVGYSWDLSSPDCCWENPTRFGLHDNRRDAQKGRLTRSPLGGSYSGISDGFNLRRPRIGTTVRGSAAQSLKTSHVHGNSRPGSVLHQNSVRHFIHLGELLLTLLAARAEVALILRGACQDMDAPAAIPFKRQLRAHAAARAATSYLQGSGKTRVGLDRGPGPPLWRC